MNEKMDLSTFFLSVASSAYMALGHVDPESGHQPQINLDLARQNIDLLELLFEKTHGNRTQDEDRLIEHLLYTVRTQYVEIQKKNS